MEKMTADELLKRIAERYREILGDDLTGIYVHGSLAFGCFNAKCSDVDFIVVTERQPDTAEKTAMTEVLLSLSDAAPEKGFEMSVVLSEHCGSFVYPTPFELHYSDAYKDDASEDITGFCERMHGTDHDLAAHFTVLREVGYAVCGKAVGEVFGEVPAEHYLDSIMRDIGGAVEDIGYNPVYYILNLCRVLGYRKGAGVLSKEQGALWAAEQLAPVWAEVVREALRCYRTGEEYPADEDIPLSFFAEYMLGEINE